MPWINVIDEDEAEGKLREVYEEVRKRRGKIANVMKIHSLNPQALIDHLNLYLTIMFKTRELKREEKEMIAVYVSKLNNCIYCQTHHSEALAKYWEKEKVKKFLADIKNLDLSKREREVLRYAHKLTKNPSKMSEEDVDRLRKIGLSDEEILTINLVTSYFNFVNRVVLGLGVELSEEEVKGYKY